MKNLIIICILATSVNYAQVGINTVTPQEALHVNGNVRVDNLIPTALTGSNVEVDANGTLILSNKKNISGKVRPNGTPININGATCFRVGAGNYQINFNTPLNNNDYLILLSNRNPTNADAPIISYYNQTNNGFRVAIKDAFLLYNINIEFMFKVEVIN
jgi:hypothetical protein